MSPTTDNNDKPTTTEAVEHTPDEVEKKKPTTWTGPRKRWVPIVVLLFVAVVAAGLTWLLTNIFQHKEEARNPFTKVVELDDSTYDPAVWGKNFPIQYEQYKKTAEDTDGDFVKVDPTADDPREYHTLSRIEMEPRAQLMWRGYAFSVDYTEPRGHEWALEDQKHTQRTQPKFKQPGTCLNCHASMPEVYDKLGNGDRMAGFHAMNSMSYEEAVQHASSTIACIDCHDPKTMELRITRPAFMEGIKKAKALEGITDYDVNRDATNQEMRTYVCAQCHVEYYFAGEGKTLTFPWDRLQARGERCSHPQGPAPRLRDLVPGHPRRQRRHLRRLPHGLPAQRCREGEQPPDHEPDGQRRDHQRVVPDLPSLHRGRDAPARREDPDDVAEFAQRELHGPGGAHQRHQGGRGQRHGH